MKTINGPQGVAPYEVYAWAMYDWANSAYSTILITILVSYLQDDAFPGNAGIVLYGWGIGVTMLISAILLPVLGAIADAHANKRHWLIGTAFGGAVCLFLMALVPIHRPWLIAVMFLATNLCFEVSFCFYNGFLPELADEEHMGRVSALGYALGYFGGGLMLLLAILILMKGESIGLPSDIISRKRIVIGLTGLWWGVFTLPIVFFLHDRTPRLRKSRSFIQTTRKAVQEVMMTLRNVKNYRILALFLLAFLMFNDGVQTMISQASVFAIQVLEMQAFELGQVILMIQFIALPAAFVVGWMGDRYGQKLTLIMCLVIWTIIAASAYFITTRTQFWILAAFAAMVMGGTQTVSRALMGLMTPKRHTAEFFGFFGLSGRATSMLGPIFFSTILASTGNPHLAITSLVVFFVAGLALTLLVDVTQGRAQAMRENKSS